MVLQQPMNRNLLPMAGHTRGKRSAVTCQLKCASACAKAVCNTSDNGYFRDIAGSALSRRKMLTGVGGALALVVTAGQVEGLGSTAAEAAQATRGGRPGTGLSFGAIDPVDAAVDEVTVPRGYRWEPIIRWGDPLFSDAPEFNPDRQSPGAQEQQFGYNNDYLDIIPLGRRNREALLVCNHEYTNAGIMFAETSNARQLDKQARIEMAAHGMAVVGLGRDGKGEPWKYVRGSRYNRRITATTRFELTGPAAGSKLLKTKADPDGRYPLGTFGNCAGGTTPWGTVLSGEENFNTYFVSPDTGAGAKRYGLANKPSSYGWERVDKRFDGNNKGYENEPNRFGYIVEIDPHDPESTPRKHTALGRMKHEGANVTVAPDGRVVAYMGDDERFDYLYKFVSRERMRKGNSKAAKRHNMSLLTDGDLYVAKFSGNSPESEIDGSGSLPSDGEFDGSGEWLPLVTNGRSRIDGMSVDEVLVFTRLAADKAGATKMDRCEDVQPHPGSGRVYVACTNNTDRGKTGKEGPTEVNPRTSNRDGHVVEITERRNDATSTRFGWTLLLVCGDPAKNDATYFSGYPAEQVSPISCPDNLAFDDSGNLWISTDGAPSTIGYNDGLFKVTLAGKNRGRVQQFLSVPTEAETCGPVVHEKDGMVFVAVQHPGEDGSYRDQHSYFPDYVQRSDKPEQGSFRLPRPSVIQVYRD
ncbi:PhoX family phosphatase [Saxibacter everestensis]|uniref:PhoX family phosphatase n=1 Tax=Saxibacter everestensis TaxID=2909229 RepID=A0ABY8QTU9_9MICO|nr:PhoX family phosphatase [Brevibacteriaceae bacterium ZFBP1038]